jgi:plastocyanin
MVPPMRRTLASLFACTSLLVVACGDDGGSSPPIDAPAAIDAPVTIDAAIDAPAATGVTEVACAGATIASEVSAPGFAFTITVPTIAVDAVVRFTMPATHSAVSGSPAGTDDGKFSVGFSTTKCFRFTAAGSYPFWCNPHQFTGTITVQ